MYQLHLLLQYRSAQNATAQERQAQTFTDLHGQDQMNCFGRFWLIAGLLMVIVGCQSTGDPNTYHEPDPNVVDTATLDTNTIESYWGFGGSFVNIMAIDGKRVPRSRWRVSDKYHITPGPHEIIAWYHSGIFPIISETIPLRFDAIAGKTYVIRASEDDDTLFVWLQDAESSDVLSKASMTMP